MGSYTKIRNGARMLGITTGIALLSGGCALLGPKVETKTYETDDGAIVVESVKLTATVKAINERTRTLTLDPKYGRDQTVQAPAEMVNFDQIRVGDEVQAEIIEEIAVSIVPGGAPESAGALEGVALAPVGDKPAIGVVSSRELTADVIAIDAHSHSVTLEFIDGSMRSVKVGKHIDLSEISLDDSVRVQITDAVAIDFQKKK
jgi:hypothetical protein